MKKEHIFLLLVLIFASLIILFLANNFSGKPINNPFASPTPYPTIMTASNNSQETVSIAPSVSKNIEVLSPRSGDSVKSAFVVKGNARTFENNVTIRLSDSEGNILAETFTLANITDIGQFGPFEKVLNFTTNAQVGSLEVFQYSAKDGSEIDKVTIPLIFD